MLTIKSFDPKSTVIKSTLNIGTTASVGPVYRLVPHNSFLEYVNFGVGIGTTSNRVITVRNLTKSMTYLNSAVLKGSAVSGLVSQLGISSSDAGFSGVWARPWISANSLLKIDWSASKGDGAIALVFARAESTREQ